MRYRLIWFITALVAECHSPIASYGKISDLSIDSHSVQLKNKLHRRAPTREQTQNGGKSGDARQIGPYRASDARAEARRSSLTVQNSSARSSASPGVGQRSPRQPVAGRVESPERHRAISGRASVHGQSTRVSHSPGRNLDIARSSSGSSITSGQRFPSPDSMQPGHVGRYETSAVPYSLRQTSVTDRQRQAAANQRDTSPDWIDEERVRIQDFKDRAARGERPDDTPASRQRRLINLHKVSRARRLRTQARELRREDDRHLGRYVDALESGQGLLSSRFAAIADQSSYSALLAASSMALRSDAEDDAANSLAANKQYSEAAKHAQKANRAFQHVETRQAHREAMLSKDVKLTSQAFVRSRTDRGRAMTEQDRNAINISSAEYKQAGEHYHREFARLQRVRDTFSGSSSSESESSDFDDVAPMRASPRRIRPAENGSTRR